MAASGWLCGIAGGATCDVLAARIADRAGAVPRDGLSGFWPPPAGRLAARPRAAVVLLTHHNMPPVAFVVCLFCILVNI